NALKRFSYVEQETKEGVAKNFVDNLFHFFIKSNYEAPVLIDQVRQESTLKNHQYEINAILKILFEASAGTPLTKAIFIAYYFQREDDTVKRKPYEQKIEHLWKLFSYVEQETKEGVAKNFVDNLFHFFIKSNYEAPVLIDQVRQESTLKNHQYEINAILKILFEASAGTPLTKAIFKNRTLVEVVR
ncbi:hypothetical protein GJ496_005457, partial [Pomphorhynchus laevis]